MIGFLTEITTCVVAKPLVLIKLLYDFFRVLSLCLSCLISAMHLMISYMTRSEGLSTLQH